jgi:hypothetical protein
METKRMLIATSGQRKGKRDDAETRTKRGTFVEYLRIDQSGRVATPKYSVASRSKGKDAKDGKSAKDAKGAKKVKEAKSEPRRKRTVRHRYDNYGYSTWGFGGGYGNGYGNYYSY